MSAQPAKAAQASSPEANCIVHSHPDILKAHALPLQLDQSTPQLPKHQWLLSLTPLLHSHHPDPTSSILPITPPRFAAASSHTDQPIHPPPPQRWATPPANQQAYPSHVPRPALHMPQQTHQPRPPCPQRRPPPRNHNGCTAIFNPIPQCHPAHPKPHGTATPPRTVHPPNNTPLCPPQRRGQQLPPRHRLRLLQRHRASAVQ